MLKHSSTTTLYQIIWLWLAVLRLLETDQMNPLRLFLFGSPRLISRMLFTRTRCAQIEKEDLGQGQKGDRGIERRGASGTGPEEKGSTAAAMMMMMMSSPIDGWTDVWRGHVRLQPRVEREREDCD